MQQISGDRWTDVTVDLPPLNGDGLVTVSAPASVQVNAPRVVVGDDDLAVDVAQADGEVKIRVGRVEGATLVLPVRAAVPVREREMSIRVSAGGQSLLLPLSLVGTVRMLPARNQWEMPSVFTIGESARCVLHLRNDGTLPLDKATVRVAVPNGVLVSGEDSRELRVGQRIAVTRIGSLAVGEGRDITLTLTVLDPAVENVGLCAEVSGEEFSATFSSEAVAVEPPGRARLSVDRVDKAVGRVGDVVRFKACIENGGATMESALLSVVGEGVEALSYPLGALYAAEKREIVLPVKITRAGVGEWDEPFSIELAGGGGVLARHDSVLGCVGEPVLVIGAAIGPADETMAHAIAIRVDNFGDAQAANARLRAKRVGDVKAVVDSLRVDERPIFAIDGAVPIFDDGVDLGTLGSGEAREVHFMVRSGAGFNGALTFYVVEASGVEAVAEIQAAITPSANREKGYVGDEPFAVRAPAPKQLADAVTSFDALARHLEDRLGLDASVPAQPEEPVAVEPEISFPEAWDETGLRYAADGEVELGRHVLALFSWLPLAAREDALNDAIHSLRAETQIVQMQYLAGLNAGMFGVSGYCFAPNAVIATLKRYMEVVGQEARSFDELSALVPLLTLTAVPAELQEWRAAVLDAIASVSDAEAFGDVFSCPVPQTREVAA